MKKDCTLPELEKESLFYMGDILIHSLKQQKKVTPYNQNRILLKIINEGLVSEFKNKSHHSQEFLTEIFDNITKSSQGINRENEFQKYLQEAREQKSDDITFQDVETAWSNAEKYNMYDVLSTLRTLVDFYESDNPDERREAEQYIETLNKVKDTALALAAKLNIPYIDNTHKSYLLGQSGFKFDVKDFFPYPLYISAEPISRYSDEGPIGILIDINGNVLEIHEGNDEASPATIALANRLVNPQGKEERVYGSHNEKLVTQIDISDMLPENLYVSPSKSHAASYWGEDRVLFTGIINLNNVNQESDLDWRTITKTPIKKMRIIG